MSAPFDPYHKWLGIPADEQPPSLYRLLGIRPLEDDLDVIETAADQRMAHLRTFQSGQHAALSQKLLNEVSLARQRLLDPEERAEYDAQLQELLAQKSALRARSASEGSGRKSSKWPEGRAPGTLDEFHQCAEGSRVLSADDSRRFLAALPEAKRPVTPKDLATELVRAGKLTRFQAGALLQGKIKYLSFGEYTILDKLGQGGMGQVLKAEHRRMKRIVALKVISGAAMKSPDAVRRFQREVHAAARLIHSNIVTAFDANEHEGVHFFVMEYVEGKDLHTLVKEQGPLSPEMAINFMAQAARGLAYAHENGIVHRDIKPGNLLIDKRGTVKILDMGLARIDLGADDGQELTNTGQVMGTVDYMAPEQAEDTHKVDARADIYSLGCTLYRLLTGDVLYGGDTVVKKLLLHRGAPIPSLVEHATQLLGSSTLDRLDPIFQKMVAKRPEDRQNSMAQVVAELERCLKGDSPSNQGSNEPTVDLKLTEFLANIASRGDSRSGSAVAEKTAKKSSPATEATQDFTGSDTSPSALAVGNALRGVPLAEVRGQGSGVKKRNLLIAAAAGGLALILLGVVLLLPTKNGTVRIEINDPSIEVTVAESGYKIKGKTEEVRVRPGEHTLHVQLGDLEFDTDKFTLGKGENPPLKVELLPGKVQVVAADGKSLGEKTRANMPVTAVAKRPEQWMIEFDGVTNDCRLDKVPFPTSGDMTLEGWIKPGAVDSVGHFISLRFNITFDKNQKWYVQASTEREFELSPKANHPDTDGLTHVAGVLQGSELRLYLAGKLAARKTLSAPIKTSQPAPTIGRGADNKRLPGIYSEIRISKVARYHEEPFTPSRRFKPDEHTLALFHCDEGQGDLLRDASGNGHDSKIVGAKWVRAESQPGNQPASRNVANSVAPPPANSPFDASAAKKHQEAWAAYLGLPVEYTNSVGMKFRLIPPGQFLMGSTEEERRASLEASKTTGVTQLTPGIESEGPQHLVTLPRPFYLGAHEVTQRQYQTIMGTNPSFFSATGANKDQVSGIDTADYPAEGLTWYAATAFCTALSRRDSLPWQSSIQASAPPAGQAAYRLPTEAEWEYACRAGTTTKYWTGDNAEGVTAVAWLSQKAPHPVGQLAANPWGLFDMHGNVMEWCQDGWRQDDYERRKSGATDPLGAAGNYHIIRGSHYVTGAIYARSAFRLGAAPDATSVVSPLGLRVAISIPDRTGSSGPGANIGSTSSAVLPADWTSLFNGRDMKGWQIRGTNNFKVNQGVLAGDAAAGTGWLMSDREFDDFELELEYRIAQGCNSGIFFGASDTNFNSQEQSEPRQAKSKATTTLTFRTSGPATGQIQLLDESDEKHANLDPKQRSGSLFTIAAPLRAPPTDRDHWYSLRLRNEGQRIQATINGDLILDAPLPSEVVKKGHLGLQIWKSSVAFRNIRVRELRGQSTLAAPAAPEQVIDLLALVDINRDSIKGNWTRTSEGLISDGTVPFGRLKLPYQPPPEYDFRVEFTPQGNHDILQLFRAGGRSCTWLMGAWGGAHDGFDTVKSRPLDREGKNLIGGSSAIRRGQRHISVVQVRRDYIAATIDGKQVVRYATDGSDLGILGDWTIGSGAIGLGTTMNRVVFHKIELTVPKPAALSPDLRAAEALHPYAQLRLALNSGKTTTFTPDQALPAEPFKVQSIEFVSGTTLPADFVTTTFLPVVTKLTDLNELKDSFQRLKVTDEAMAAIAQAPCAATLAVIDLVELRLTPESMAALKRFPKLNLLRAIARKADDDTLAQLKDLSPLNSLRLESFANPKPIAGKVAAAIAAHPLKYLDIHGAEIGPELARAIGQMQNLTSFGNTGATLSQEALKEVVKSPRITILYIQSTPLSDSHLEIIAELKSLRSLNVRQTAVTEAGVKKFAERMPLCEVFWDGGNIKPRTADKSSAQAPPAGDWIELFSGRDIAGWTAKGHKGWSVTAGGILSGETSGAPGWLMTNREFDNFELELDYRLPAGGNSGIFFRAAESGPVSGSEFYEIQLLDDVAQKFATVDPKGRTGALFGSLAPANVPVARNSEWHDLRVRVFGQRLQVTLKGKDVLDGQLPPGKGEKGHIGLQLYAPGAAFRKLRVRELNSDGSVKLADAQASSASTGSIPSPASWTHRAIAEWVIQRGGKLSIGQQKDIAKVDDLPPGTWRITVVDLSLLKNIGDAEAAVIGEWPDIRGVSMAGTSITDVGLRHLARLSLGGSFDVSGTAITGEGFDSFAGRSVGTLVMARNSIAGTKLPPCPLTPEGWRRLAAVGNTKHWYLSESNLTDARLQDIVAKHPEIEVLHAICPALTDVSADALVTLLRLNNLRLDSTQFTDAGFLKLRQCKSLTAIYVKNTKVSAAGVKAFHQALPKCRIEWNDGTVEPEVAKTP
jgi:serine/threonine protein kinase/formylglycine-generating enzyme required for sulfatase activity